MKRIPLSKNGKNKGIHFALVDDEDFELVSKIRWHLHKGAKTNYARGWDQKTNANIYMHRLILSVKDKSITIDHIDHNGLNNQRQNIRTATLSQQRKNSTPIGISKYLGVTYDKSRGKWKSSICINGKTIHLGRFASEEEAAKARDIAAIKYHGKWANINLKNKSNGQR